jgi:hydroxylaminobenzene mutase
MELRATSNLDGERYDHGEEDSMAQDTVCFSGLLLFVLGLLNGLIIPKSKSPRLSLSAHLTAVQSGTFLIAIAWAWPHFNLPARMSILMAWALGGSMFVLWFAFFLAGIWGAGRNLPIAGLESKTEPVRQGIVTMLLGLGVTGTIGASAFLLFRLSG